MVWADSISEKKWLEAQGDKTGQYFPVEIVPKKDEKCKEHSKNTWNLVLSWLKGVPAKKCQPKQGEKSIPVCVSEKENGS